MEFLNSGTYLASLAAKPKPLLQSAEKLCIQRARSIALQHGCRIDVPLLIAASAVLLHLGCTAPMMQTKAFFFWRNELSIWSAVNDLWGRGDQSLAVVVGALAIGFPALKLLMLTFLWLAPCTNTLRSNLLRRIDFLSRWAMLDVFVVAVVVVIIKAGGLVKAEPRLGLYLFAGSVIASMLATVLLARLCRSD